jgi:hypothetical protein
MVRNVFSDDLFPSQPASTSGSSQSQSGRGDDGSEETVERAFWQSTPTELQELREGTDREKEKEEWHREAGELQLTVSHHHPLNPQRSLGPRVQTRGHLVSLH